MLDCFKILQLYDRIILTKWSLFKEKTEKNYVFLKEICIYTNIVKKCIVYETDDITCELLICLHCTILLDKLTIYPKGKYLGSYITTIMSKRIDRTFVLAILLVLKYVKIVKGGAIE